VKNLAKGSAGLALTTPKGRIRADKIVLATNGYSGALLPWHRRRIIPIGSYMIATEPIAPELMNRLFPTDRVITDTRKLDYFTCSRPTVLFRQSVVPIAIPARLPLA